MNAEHDFFIQGLWSNFKGVFGWGHTTREKERADAKTLINQSLRFTELLEKNYLKKDSLTFQQA